MDKVRCHSLSVLLLLFSIVILFFFFESGLYWIAFGKQLTNNFNISLTFFYRLLTDARVTVFSFAEILENKNSND